MESQIVKYYNAISKHYKISDSEYYYKEYNNYILFEINNELFIVVTNEQISQIMNNYFDMMQDTIHLPYEYRFLEDYIDKEAYIADCWEESEELYFIDNMIEDDGFRFTYIDTIHEILF